MKEKKLTDREIEKSLSRKLSRVLGRNVNVKVKCSSVYGEFKGEKKK